MKRRIPLFVVGCLIVVALVFFSIRAGNYAEARENTGWMRVTDLPAGSSFIFVDSLTQLNGRICWVSWKSELDKTSMKCSVNGDCFIRVEPIVPGFSSSYESVEITYYRVFDDSAVLCFKETVQLPKAFAKKPLFSVHGNRLVCKEQ